MALASLHNSLLSCSQQPPSLFVHSSQPRARQSKRGVFIGARAAGIEDSSITLASWCIQPKSRRVKPCIAAASSNEGENETKEEAIETPSAPSSVTEAAKPTISQRRAEAEAEVKKGQRLALVTGAISVLLGVGYLVLIQLLDTRGVILVPPPPEAFDP